MIIHRLWIFKKSKGGLEISQRKTEEGKIKHISSIVEISNKSH